MRLSLRPWPLVAIAVAAAGMVIGAPVRQERAAAQPEYALYYRFEVPLVIQGIALSDDGTKQTYNGTLRGTLGGIPVADARYTYANGASTRAGGGTFALTTKAAPFRDGHVLMTNDGKQTTVLFLGIYLGARVSFSITGPGDQIGGSGVTAAGLAETTFRSHEEYVAAIRSATAALAPAARDLLIGQADQNPRLVREYQQRSAPR